MGTECKPGGQPTPSSTQLSRTLLGPLRCSTAQVQAPIPIPDTPLKVPAAQTLLEASLTLLSLTPRPPFSFRT